MSTKSETELWKLIGGGAIILVAFAIMMPGILDYVGRLGRLIAMVLIAVAIALTVVVAKSRLMKRTASGSPSQAAGTTSGDTTPAAKQSET